MFCFLERKSNELELNENENDLNFKNKNEIKTNKNIFRLMRTKKTKMVTSELNKNWNRKEFLN